MKQFNVGYPDERVYMYDDFELNIRKTDIDSKHLARMINRYKKCISLANCRGGRWLDVACGSGYGTELISEVADNVVGVDIDTKTIEYANTNHKTRDNISFLNRNILDLVSLDDISFDVIVSVETIEHLSDAKPFLYRTRQLLKQGGVLVVTTPESQIGGGPNPHNKFHLNEYTLSQFKRILKEMFGNVKIETEKAIFTTGLETVQMYAVCNKGYLRSNIHER